MLTGCAGDGQIPARSGQPDRQSRPRAEARQHQYRGLFPIVIRPRLLFNMLDCCRQWPTHPCCTRVQGWLVKKVISRKEAQLICASEYLVRGCAV